jgi:hypothetical protein
LKTAVVNGWSWRRRFWERWPAMSDEFGNDEYAIRQVALAAHIRGDYEAERIALDRLALMERATVAAMSDQPGLRTHDRWHRSERS